MPQDNFGGWKKISFPPWLPVAASVVLMVMVAFVGARNLRHLNDATQWRRHSAYIILAEQSFQNNLLDIQRGLRGYVTLGDMNALASFYKNSITEQEHFQELSSLTGDNPTQQRRLKNLGTAITALLEFDKQAIIIYQQQGFAEISKLD